MTVSILSVTYTIIPLFIIMLIGVASRLLGIIDWPTTKKLSSFLVNVTQPLLIISSFQTALTKDKLKIALAIVAASVVMHIAFSILARFFFKGSEKSDRSVMEFCLIFGNCAFLGYPILQAVFPSSGLFYGAVFNLVFMVYIRIYGVFLLNRGKSGSKPLLKALVNPGTIASLIGILLFVFSISLPKVIATTVSTVGGLTFPLSMIVVGSLLCNQPFMKLFAPKLYIFSFARLVLLPVLVLTLCSLFFLDKGLTYICVIMACVPTAASAAMFSELYKANSPLAASLVGITSMFSILTIPGMLALTNLVMKLLGR